MHLAADKQLLSVGSKVYDVVLKFYINFLGGWGGLPEARAFVCVEAISRTD